MRRQNEKTVAQKELAEVKQKVATLREKLRGVRIAMAEDATEEVAVGDRAIYKQFPGTEVTIDGEDHVLLSFEDPLVKYVAADEIPG